MLSGRSMSRVLVIGDTHSPVMLVDYVDFLRDTYVQWKCDRVVHIGDVANWECMSYHEKRVGTSPDDEVVDARAQIKELEKAFREMDVMLGNHDALPERKARTFGFPAGIVKTPGEIWETKRWRWHPRWSILNIDGVLYQHGDKGKGGKDAAIRNSRENFASLVQGHHHQLSFVQYYANELRRCFGMQVGCGINWSAAAMEYGMKFNAKPVISCGVVIDGQYAYTEPMLL